RHSTHRIAGPNQGDILKRRLSSGSMQLELESHADLPPSGVRHDLRIDYREDTGTSRAVETPPITRLPPPNTRRITRRMDRIDSNAESVQGALGHRSEERRVGKEVRYRVSEEHEEKKMRRRKRDR